MIIVPINQSDIDVGPPKAARGEQAAEARADNYDLWLCHFLFLSSGVRENLYHRRSELGWVGYDCHAALLQNIDFLRGTFARSNESQEHEERGQRCTHTEVVVTPEAVERNEHEAGHGGSEERGQRRLPLGKPEERSADEERRRSDEKRARPSLVYKDMSHTGELWDIVFENLGGPFTVKGVHTQSGLERVTGLFLTERIVADPRAFHKVELVQGEGGLVEAGDQQFFRVRRATGDPPLVAWMVDIAYGHGRLGRLEISGKFGSALDVRFEER